MKTNQHKPKTETVAQECARMKKMMQHYRKLTKPSRDFVRYLVEKYQWENLPEEVGQQ